MSFGSGALADVAGACGVLTDAERATAAPSAAMMAILSLDMQASPRDRAVRSTTTCAQHNLVARGLYQERGFWRESISCARKHQNNEEGRFNVVGNRSLQGAQFPYCHWTQAFRGAGVTKTRDKVSCKRIAAIFWTLCEAWALEI